jgi:hypothetical protein
VTESNRRWESTSFDIGSNAYGWNDDDDASVVWFIIRNTDDATAAIDGDISFAST